MYESDPESAAGGETCAMIMSMSFRYVFPVVLVSLVLGVAASVVHAQTFTGTPRADEIHGTPGPDVINGRGGDDKIFGGGGADKLNGGKGDDVIAGDAGNDRISGGPGDDTLLGGAGNDRISGGAGSDQVFGGAGNDIISVRDGEVDTVHCGAGRDRVIADPDDVVGKDCEVVSRG